MFALRRGSSRIICRRSYFRGASKSPQKPYESLQEARSAYEREFVLRKLEENRWNMTKAAQALGLERSHLYRKMRSLGIAPTRV